MYSLIEKSNYRKDIDGLRAIAVLVVFVFHCGYLPAGYLGVDIFFVISGYLITKIIYLKSIDGNFSVIDFYLRRIRRIIPLVSFFCLLTLIIGLLVMLPDDLENLAQSIVATNFFGNNILQFLTTRNYWDVVNEFKPLMHTWSLGIEEQYYFFYPFVFLALSGRFLRYVLPILMVLTIFSLSAYFLNSDAAANFYLLPARFFELSIGGLGAVLLKNQLIQHKFRMLFILILICLCIFEFPGLPKSLVIPLVVLFTLALLISSSSNSSFSTSILENKIMVGLGKISFSIYMWHQVILAFSRYFILEEITIPVMVGMLFLTLALSVATYYFIEQPFRNKKRVRTSVVLSTLATVIFLTTATSLYIYSQAGVMKDIPELGIKMDNVSRGMHAQYNDRINLESRNFKKDANAKVLVIGDSFGRDWANVLLESKFKDSVDLVYFNNHLTDKNTLLERMAKADVIFWSEASPREIGELKIDDEVASNIWCVGTKNFGINNGIFYNYSGEDYCLQRTTMEEGYLQLNEALKRDWGNHYIDLIELVADEQNKVPVFTDECKFISQDTRHLTQSGAQYFARLVEQDPEFVLNAK